MLRKVRKLAVGLLAMVVMLGLAFSAQAGDTVKFGAAYIMSGPFSAYGQFAKKGIELAVDEINATGGIMGKKVEFSVEDSTGKANVAIQAFRKLVYQEKADLLLGIDSSGVARGVAPTIPELQKPLMITPKTERQLFPGCYKKREPNWIPFIL